MRIARAHWTSASFLLYAGALMALLASVNWLGVIADARSEGALAGWSVLFWVVAEILAIWLLAAERRVAAGLFAVVGLGLFAFMVGAFFQWFGWLSDLSSPFSGFHVGDLLLELLVFFAALIGLGIWRFPLLVLPTAFIGWFFLTDLVSGGGNWTKVVTILIGLFLFLLGVALDAGDTRPYGFWVHVVAGGLIGATFVSWWHTSDLQWAGIIVISLIFILTGAGMRRSSYAVLGVLGLIGASYHYASNQSPSNILNGEPPVHWPVPVAFVCLGIFLFVLGTGLYRSRSDAE